MSSLVDTNLTSHFSQARGSSVVRSNSGKTRCIAPSLALSESPLRFRDMAPEDARPSCCHCKTECFGEFDDGRSVASETTVIPRRDLGLFDVAALIINKQIGAGIFTTPGLVLGLTRSKTIATALWMCGGLWSFLGILIYVEFVSAFPFNGGELIYLDEVFKRPELLSAIMYSSFFLISPNTAGNAIQFAKLILLAAKPEAKRTEDLDRDLISFIAIVGLTAVCFIHYFSRNSGLFLNIFFVVYKIILLGVTIICGGIASTQPENGKSTWGYQGGNSDMLAALVFVIYSYQGWENANYVGGELNVPKRTLKWGAFLGIGITTLLYTLVTVIYSLACPFDLLITSDLDIVLRFAPKVFGHTGAQAFKICIALSALGHVLVVVYTSAKVKQQMARQCFLPFYKFFARADIHFGTPLGALILHWVVTVIWIGATPNTTGGISFVMGVFIYGQLIIGFLTGFAFFWIRRTYQADAARRDEANPSTEWHPIILQNPLIRHVVTLLFMGTSLMVLVEGAKCGGDPPAWLWPPIFGGMALIGFTYWLILWNIARESTDKSMLQIRILTVGMLEEVEGQDRAALTQALVEGNTRVVVYKARGKLGNLLKSIDVGLSKLKKWVTW